MVSGKPKHNTILDLAAESIRADQVGHANFGTYAPNEEELLNTLSIRMDSIPPASREVISNLAKFFGRREAKLRDELSAYKHGPEQTTRWTESIGERTGVTRKK